MLEISNISNEHVEVIKNDYPYLHNLWFSGVCQTKEELVIDLLIGSDYLWGFQKGQTIQGELEGLVAVETKLGWVLSGPLKRKGLDSQQEVSLNFVARESVAIVKDSLESTVSQLWDQGSLGIKVSDDVHGFQWPEFLDCSKLPARSHLCLSPPSPTPSFSVPSTSSV